MDEIKERGEKLILHQPERTGEFLVVRQLKAENTALTTRSDKKVWKVHDENDDSLILATEHRTPRKDQPNLIDQKTLYDSKRTNVASRVLDPPHPPKRTRYAGLTGNREDAGLNNITKSYGTNQQIDSFRYMIMNSFYRTPATPPPTVNHTKHPLVREGSLYYHLVESLKRQKQRRDQIEMEVSLMKPVTCKFNEGSGREYCDILGPVSCSRCIENTNRHIATEIQRGIFPDIEVTLNSLVVPNASKVMKSGLTRKKRFRKLSVLNINGFTLRRQETQLRQSDLRRPFTKSTKLPSFSSSSVFPAVTSSFISSRNITSLTLTSYDVESSLN